MWEYFIAQLPVNELGEKLNDWGKAGWELVCLNAILPDNEYVMGVFKKEIKP